MIDLITGLPGNCKTLYTIAWVRQWAKKDSRAVFYSGIPLSDEGKEKLGWIEIEPEKWMEVPPNSIVVIDECQRVFRNRTLGQVPGKHVTELETHRHKGIDLVFITQHPSLIDPAIRRLAGRHRHMVRIFGMEKSTVHQWSAVRDNCDKPPARKDSEKQVWAFDKSVYSLYKSAEVHTVKRAIPMRLKLLLLVPVLLLLAGWTVYRLMFKPKLEPASAIAHASPGQAPAQTPGVLQVGAAKPFDPVADARQYVYNNQPRVVGLPHTAPRYDEVTKPVTAPIPVACVATAKRCSCFTQQATVMAVPDNLCREIVDKGFFKDFEDGSTLARRDQGRAERTSAEEHQPVLKIASVDRDGYGVLGRAGPGVRDPQQTAQAAPQPTPDLVAPRQNTVPAGSPWRAM